MNKSNIYDIIQYQESVWELCREVEKESDYKSCETCPDRFKCWTASNPQILWDNDLYRKVQKQLCEAMTKKLDEGNLNGL